MNLIQIHNEIYRLEKEAVIAMQDEFPIGSLTCYRHGDQLRNVRVIEHNPYHPRMIVRGATSRKYWIDAIRCADAQ